jgi:hypothetical protein
MPLYNVQRRALAVISLNRHPGSHVVDGTVINLDGSRFSQDIDIFHDLATNPDRVNLLRQSVFRDEAALLEAGFIVNWRSAHPELYEAVIEIDGEKTALEWRIDSDFRFFEAVPDEIFGFTLHKFDLATNKVLAAAARQEPRDVLDLIHLHENGIPFPAMVWAAPAKDPGFTPEALIADLRRNTVYRQDDYDRVIGISEIDAREVGVKFKLMLSDALKFVETMPAELEGLVHLSNGVVAQPDPAKLEQYDSVAAKRHAHWPSSPEIASAMIRTEPTPKS